MRRLARLQRLAALPKATPAPPVRAFSTTRAAPFRQSPARADDKQRQEVLEALERDRQSAISLSETEPLEAEPVVPESSSIVVPPEFSYAPAPKEAGDYEPAQTGKGLEEVGGLEGWWDVKGHLGEADKLRVFSERVSRKVTEPSVLEVLVRQAVVEALVVQGKGGEMLMGRWGGLGKAAMIRAGGVEVTVSEAGDVTLNGDLEAVLEGLKEDEEDEVAAQEPVEAENAADEAEMTPEEHLAAAAAAEATETQERLTAQEAAKMIKSWDHTWRKVPLTDPSLKFAIHKRIYQLTGHRIPDAKLAPFQTAHHLAAHVARPARSRKVLDEIRSARRGGELLNLPNVKVYGRRVTPIDKEVWVGRWKVIEGELRKRGLPVTGLGGYGKAREKDWLMGKP